MTPDLQALLSPGSIALVGVSADPRTIRGRLLHVLLQRGYAGKLFLVSRSVAEVQGRSTWPSITDLPEPVDLALLAAPARFVPDLLEECGRKGIRAALVVASGFAEERGGAGAVLQERLRAVAERYGIAVCGPNCEGLVNCLAPVAATFSPTLENPAFALHPPVDPGRRIGVISQSGAFTFSFLNRSQDRQIAFSYMVSSGNEACLKAADYIDFMLADGRTDIILLYLEGVADAPRLLAAAARAADAGKPLIVAKPGRSEAVRRAAASHTGSMVGDARVVEAAFREHGILRGEDIDAMIDVAVGLSWCRPPRGRGVALISASGGGAVWMAEMLAAAGLDVPPLDDATRAEIAALLPSYGSAENPVDLTAAAIREIGYARVIGIVQRSPAINMVLVIGSLAYEYGIEKDREALARVTAESDKPVVFCTYTTASPRALALLAGAGIAAYTSMPNCARALAALAEQSEFRARWARDRAGRRALAEPAAEDAAVRARLLEAGPVLCEVDAKQALAGVLPRLPERLAGTEQEAADAAGAIGYPVALKAQSPALTHKTEAGAVALALADEAAVRAAWRDMAARLSGAEGFRGMLVQKMAPPGVEVILGTLRDPGFGPMLMIGLGGIFVEVLDDVVLAPAPVTVERARELILTLRGAKMLSGVRGRPPADLHALAALASALSAFAARHADLVAEIDLNPVIVHEHGLSVVDALMLRESGCSTPARQQNSLPAHGAGSSAEAMPQGA
ncbi:MAG: acetate--CoA ligase family protein [Acidisphaera sp.]|nr:acetate--CoA ligase family protein [Acidisphaera sp.]